MIFSSTKAYRNLGKSKFKGNNIYPILQNDKVGFINKDGNIVIKPEFGDMIFDDEGMIAFLDIQSDSWGYMDQNFNVIFKPQIHIIRPEKFSEGLAAYYDDNKKKWGYVDKFGNIVINPRFIAVNSFVDNYAVVSVNELKESCWQLKEKDFWGIINLYGEFVLEPEYEHLRYSKNGLFTALKDGHWGCIDKDNNVIIPFMYEWLSLNEFADGLSFAKYEGKWGVIDINNNVVIDFKIKDRFDELEGCRGIGRGISEEGPVKAYCFNNKWILFNEKGMPKKTLSGYNLIMEYNNGYARAITEDEMECIIDKEGQIVFSCLYNGIEKSGPFSEGFAAVPIRGEKHSNNVKYGYIDCGGNMIIKPKFDCADQFFEGAAGVDMYTNGCEWKSGIIDIRGNYLVQPQYSYITRFYNGIASVTIGDFPNVRFGYINNLGQVIYEPRK